MNAGKRARYVGSITNQNQGGGSKKAGFPYEIGRSSWTTISFNERGYPATFAFMSKTVNPNVRQNRPAQGPYINPGYWQVR